MRAALLLLLIPFVSFAGIVVSGGGGGIKSLGGLNGSTQTFATGTAGADFAISSSGTTHTFNIPSASGTNRGLLTSADWTTFNNKLGAAITSLGGLTGATQTFAAGTTGTDFAISSSGTTHTFNIPDASGTARGLVTTGTQTFAGSKTFSGSLITFGSSPTMYWRTGALDPTGQTDGSGVDAQFLRVTGTMTSGLAGGSNQTQAARFDITSAGNGTEYQTGLYVRFRAGNTGSGRLHGIQVNSETASTMTDWDVPGGNAGIYSVAQGTSASGANFGVVGWADNAAKNYGLYGIAYNGTNKEKWGVIGRAIGNYAKAGYFTLETTSNGPGIAANQIFALACNNGSTTDDCFRVYDNNSLVSAIKDGGTFLQGADFKLITVGTGIYIEEGTNATSGAATLSSGTVTVNTTKVTANSRIQLTGQDGSSNIGSLWVSARSAGTSFTISSTNASSDQKVAWLIIEDY